MIPHLPGALKGVDMAVYDSFKALGYEVMLKPVFRKANSSEDRERPDEAYMSGIAESLPGCRTMSVEACPRFMPANVETKCVDDGTDGVRLDSNSPHFCRTDTGCRLTGQMHQVNNIMMCCGLMSRVTVSSMKFD